MGWLGQFWSNAGWLKFLAPLALFYVAGALWVGSLSNYAENKALDHLFKTATFTPPTHWYVALFTAAPDDTGGGTEVSGGSYARVICDTWNAASSGSIANTGAITFTTATGSWGTVTHFAIFDASSGGNMLCWGSLTTSKTVGSGDTASFGAGAFVVTLD